MPKRITDGEATDALATKDERTTVQKLNDFLANVPSYEEDPTETMLTAILAASNPSEWDALFSAASFKDSDKATIQINAYRPAESQFNGGLRYFLVLDVTDLKTGVRGVMTCGSTMAMAQVVNAERTVGLPIQVEVVRKPTPTKAGFHPMHLKYIGRTETPLGDPQAVVSEQ